jgi:tetratricopeptide (TPR) repeat protein
LSKNAYNHGRDTSTAVFWATRWLSAAPEDLNAYIWLAGLYLWRGEHDKAAQILEQGKPFGVETNRFYPGQAGQIYQARGEWDRALLFYRQSWTLNQDDPTMVPYVAWYLGLALYQQGALAEAQQYLEIARQAGEPPLQEQAAQLLITIREKNGR